MATFIDNIVKAMDKIVKAEKQKGLLTHYLTDLEIDIEEITYGSQSGINYLWIIKANGCGTWLYDANASGKDYALQSEPDNTTSIYLVSMTGINRGYISRISKADALSYQYDKPKNLIPRRKHTSQVLFDVFPGINIKETKLFCDWRTNPNESVLLKISYNSHSKCVSIEAKREVINPFDYEDESLIERNLRYTLPLSIEMINRLGQANKPTYVEIKNTQQFYAKKRELTQDEYNALMDKPIPV
ncbi:hypothetical protein [Photobacterium sp. GB-72]|uniref:hypothetical protein n=1 Tax=Photobacterium sp. GB-72 TaxID=2022105 RepID=UPI000D159521|nr:hypothetical protein [Photobacterium sp. GB-72]PSV26266.1 hypothetical protein C9J40_21530 [Photobacterium sp. GB-72]